MVVMLQPISGSTMEGFISNEENTLQQRPNRRHPPIGSTNSSTKQKPRILFCPDPLNQSSNPSPMKPFSPSIIMSTRPILLFDSSITCINEQGKLHLVHLSPLDPKSLSCLNPYHNKWTCLLLRWACVLLIWVLIVSESNKGY